MSEMEQATLNSSSSQLETVQPFTIEESPGLEVGIESPKLMDSNTFMCTSIDRSPVISGALKYASAKRLKHNANGFSNQQSHNNDVTTVSSDSSDASIGRDSSDASDMNEDDFATNQSARSTASEQLSTSRTSSETSNMDSTSDKTNTNDNKATDDDSELENEETPNASDAVESGENLVSDLHSSSTEAGATGVQSSESEGDLEGEQTESVFANFPDSAEATSEPADRLGAPRLSVRGNAKNELANLIEKAILDFCSSRTVETMRRMFGGVTNDNGSLKDGGRQDDKSGATPHPVTGELVKEGVIIGDVDIFAPRMQREYILPVRDCLISAFIKDPGVFRAICYRTRCQVEVTRRLLNRKLCIGGRWHKYMIIRILGPTYKCISNCDVLLQKAVPDYKARKEYPVQSVCRVFLREDVPDNAELYYSYQRTGGTSQRYGALKLESPYRSALGRNVSTCPWKYGLFKPGKLAFSCPNVRMCMKHVYPSFGYQTTTNLENEYQGVNATERIQALHEQFHMRRQAALVLKRNLTIPVCR